LDERGTGAVVIYYQNSTKQRKKLTDDITDAYAIFIDKLCEMACRQKRVLESSADGDNHNKYVLRCYQLRLWFIPQRSERKGIIMMVPLLRECRESKVRYPVPWDGKGGNAS
jgi:hypothetical protein